MNQATLALNLRLTYSHIPAPQRIIIQLEPGEIRLLKTFTYRQHESDPLCVENLSIHYDSPDKIQIRMQLNGRLVFSPGGEIRFNGTDLVLVCRPEISENELQLRHAIISEIHFPMMPKLVKAILRALINKNIVPNLSKSLNFDLEALLYELRDKINNLEPVAISVGEQLFHFQALPHLGEVEHELRVHEQGVDLYIHLSFEPDFLITEQKTVDEEELL